MALDVKAEVIEPFEGAIAVWTCVHFWRGPIICFLWKQTTGQENKEVLMRRRNHFQILINLSVLMLPAAKWMHSFGKHHRLWKACPKNSATNLLSWPLPPSPAPQTLPSPGSQRCPRQLEHSQNPLYRSPRWPVGSPQRWLLPFPGRCRSWWWPGRWGCHLLLLQQPGPPPEPALPPPDQRRSNRLTGM